jgi:hypothetical protein
MDGYCNIQRGPLARYVFEEFSVLKRSIIANEEAMHQTYYIYAHGFSSRKRHAEQLALTNSLQLYVHEWQATCSFP